MNIRLIEESDAEAFLKLQQQLDTETEFMMFEPGERDMDLDYRKESVRRYIEDPRSAVWVLEKEGRLLGFLAAFGNKPRRIQHRAYLVVGILQEAAGQGYGTKLFIELDRWAKEVEIHRLELTVMTHNEAGIALYKKMGFEVEGVKRHAMRLNGNYVDEYYMAKLI
ncbi:GNAT family N-acetyltransferase [Alkalihalobacillus sp. TS-13]|uniref:GNAT family N-acetyltransferase n=1 Tax=Alkalihalobacillus sp. TS-13 TaxID=2842455 RepID=UPI001C88761D|nr:GNAT family N-acetyltransferase [Alkalihalobacillus sp. TS-13]